MKRIGVCIVLVAAALLCNNSFGSSGVVDANTLEKDYVCETGNDDLFGYYIPNTPIRTGKLELAIMGLGGRQEFQDYEAGRNKVREYAPFLFEFNDVTSRKRTNELGDDYYEKQIRVLPKTYKVTATTLTFYGTDKLLGDVRFSGKINLKALKIAKNETEEQREPVVTGDLTFAGKTFKNVEFNWYGGD